MCHDGFMASQSAMPSIHPRFIPRAYNYSEFITGDNKIRHTSDIHGTRLKYFISHNSSKKSGAR